MIVGLPGTGIGGLFYLVAALLMPVSECGRWLRHRSSPARWKLIAQTWIVLGGAGACMWVMALALKAVLAAGRGMADRGSAADLARVVDRFLASAGWASAACLGMIVLAVHILRLVGTRSKGKASGTRGSVSPAARA
ncbi:MAG: hypothetical protein ACRENJ_10960 [Candidatus Eiseniibacteriota bacterium]